MEESAPTLETTELAKNVTKTHPDFCVSVPATADARQVCALIHACSAPRVGRHRHHGNALHIHMSELTRLENRYEAAFGFISPKRFPPAWAVYTRASEPEN